MIAVSGAGGNVGVTPLFFWLSGLGVFCGFFCCLAVFSGC